MYVCMYVIIIIIILFNAVVQPSRPLVFLCILLARPFGLWRRAPSDKAIVIMGNCQLSHVASRARGCTGASPSVAIAVKVLGSVDEVV